MYDVVLFQSIGWENFYVTLTKRITLPFVPRPGISLGLYDCSEFQCDDYKVERIMYHVPNNEFHCELETTRMAEYGSYEVVDHYLKEGWRVKPMIVHECKDDALDEPDCEILALVNGEYWELSDSQFEVLKMQGDEFELLKHIELTGVERP